MSNVAKLWGLCQSWIITWVKSSAIMTADWHGTDQLRCKMLKLSKHLILDKTIEQQR